MKKKLFFIVMTLVLAVAAFSQEQEQDTVTTENIGIYTLKSFQNTDNTFGYEIFIADSLVERQTKRVFATLSSGFIVRSNAMKVGRWFVTELSAGRNNKYALSIPRARELGVTEIDLITNPNN